TRRSSDLAVQAPHTINARFISLIVAWYDALDRTGRASWSESCELHKAVTRRLYAASCGALRLSAGRFIHATTAAQRARTCGRRRDRKSTRRVTGRRSFALRP